FLVTTHQNPDGDAVGSLLAMAHLLRAELDKYVVAVLPDPVAKRYRFLPGLNTLVLPRIAGKQGPFDALVTLDVSSPTRIGGVNDLIKPGMTRINIDHHVTNPRSDDVCWVNTEASATSEMVVDIYRELGAIPTPDVATALYTGILTDTGQFAFPSTTAKTLHAAAELVEQGAAHEQVALETYRKTEAKNVRALGQVISRMQLFDDDSFAISWVSHDELDVDHEGFVNTMLDIDTVEIAALIRPLDSGQWKLSMRSAGMVDVAELAKNVAGGGHPLAAGGTLKAADINSALASVTEMCLKALTSARG
ncbi:MAG TPA: bifunctional oligoribonuclease/PAP phosphatase NrnA, partial [Bacteroidetes bacterium]|nr:bifunctional oligoribonuclease/PAP phosphatase NrnA [Bacteroidota bacterium]HEX03917.1 bifunctional oligoribonuclease/PAP phosphatase NrnA [Bacteroidota bacterium]